MCPSTFTQLFEAKNYRRIIEDVLGYPPCIADYMERLNLGKYTIFALNSLFGERSDYKEDKQHVLYHDPTWNTLIKNYSSYQREKQPVPEGIVKALNDCYARQLQGVFDPQRLPSSSYDG